MNAGIKSTLTIIGIIAVAFFLYINSVFTACLYTPDKCSFAFERNDITIPEEKQIVISSMLVVEDVNAITLNPFIGSNLPALKENEILLVVDDTDPVYSIEVAGQVIKPTFSFISSLFDPSGPRSYFFIAPKDVKGYFYTYRTFNSGQEEKEAQKSMLDILVGPGGSVFADMYQINGEDSVIYIGNFDIPSGIKESISELNENEFYLIIETSLPNIGTLAIGDNASSKYLYRFNYYGSSIYRYLFIVPKSYLDAPESNFQQIPVGPNTVI